MGASEKAVIATENAQHLRWIRTQLQRSLGSKAVAQLLPNMSPKSRGKAVRHFREDTDVRCLVLSARTAGVGLNLQRANHLIVVDQYLDSGSASQLVGRLHRQGQTRRVHVHRLRLKSTTDEVQVFRRGPRNTINVQQTLIELLNAELT